MAFFCTKSGVRIVAPGIAVGEPGGTIPVYDGSEDHVVAEQAAAVALKTPGSGGHSPPNETTIAAAQRAALEVLLGPANTSREPVKPAAAPPAPKPAPALERPAKAAAAAPAEAAKTTPPVAPEAEHVAAEEAAAKVAEEAAAKVAEASATPPPAEASKAPVAKPTAPAKPK